MKGGVSRNDLEGNGPKGVGLAREGIKSRLESSVGDVFWTRISRRSCFLKSLRFGSRWSALKRSDLAYRAARFFRRISDISIFPVSDLGNDGEVSTVRFHSRIWGTMESVLKSHRPRASFFSPTNRRYVSSPPTLGDHDGECEWKSHVLSACTRARARTLLSLPNRPLETNPTEVEIPLRGFR